MWPSLLPSPSQPWASTQAPYHTPYVHSDHSTHTQHGNLPLTYTLQHTHSTHHTPSLKQTILLIPKHYLT